MPRISILMPVYNGMPYICEAVDSVFAQNIEDWEFLISDNGSTDGTLTFLDTS
jgi:glycosyltransferase involved in cell wall biosynthesis